MEKIKVLIIEPAYSPVIKEIENILEEKQKIVGGNIEFVELENNVDLICNEYGKMNNLEMNRIIKNDVICGTFIVAGQENGESKSLTEKQIEKYKKYFSTRKHTIPIAILRNKCKESSELLNCNLIGVEILLEIGDLFRRK